MKFQLPVNGRFLRHSSCQEINGGRGGRVEPLGQTHTQQPSRAKRSRVAQTGRAIQHGAAPLEPQLSVA